MTLFEGVVEAAIPQYPPLSGADAATLRTHVLSSVARQFRSAPLQIRLAVGVILLAFGFYCLASKGRVAQALAPADRSAALSAFTRRTPAYFSALERLVRSASVLAYLEHPIVLSAAGYEPIGERRTRRIALRQRA